MSSIGSPIRPNKYTIYLAAALHLDECDFSTLTASDWSQVLVLRPDLVGKFESIERDWSKDAETDDIDEILQDSP